MSFDLQSVAIDTRKLVDGVIWEVYRDTDGSLAGRVVKAPTDQGCVHIIPMGADYERVYGELLRPILPALRVPALAQDERDRMTREVEAQALAKTVLRGWWNITVKGEPVTWSEAKATELLSDPRWSSLREFIVLAGRHKGCLLEQEEEQAKGN